MFELMDAYSQNGRDQGDRRRRRRRQRRRAHGQRAASRASISSASTPTRRRSSTRKVKTAPADRLQHHQGTRRRRQSRSRPAGGDGRSRPHHRADRRLRHAVHHRRHGRRHRHRRGAGRGAAREGAGHPHGRGRHQAVRRWKAASASRSRSRASPSSASTCDSLITIPNEKLLTVLGRDDDAARRVQGGEPSAAGRGAGHRRADHASGPDQRRLRRRAHRDVRDRHGDDGLRLGERRGPRARRGRGGVSQPAARGRQPVGRARHPGQRHRRHRPVASASSTRSATPSSSSPPKTRPSWSAP